MAKYKKGLVDDIKKEQRKAALQAELREKYHAEENVIIKEKKSALKFILRLCISGIKLLIQIVLILMAAIGCLSLLYPDVRRELLQVLMQIIFEVQTLVPIKI
ncbi:hypothetical protein ABXS75_10905 [Roseburia hominis]